jgi:hypothetical protein
MRRERLLHFASSPSDNDAGDAQQNPNAKERISDQAVIAEQYAKNNQGHSQGLELVWTR